MLEILAVATLEYTTLHRSPLYMTELLTRKLKISEFQQISPHSSITTEVENKRFNARNAKLHTITITLI